jgi:hypothetical protein
MDYFVFTRNGWEDLPPFTLGRPVWDNWMVYHARRLGRPVVDATLGVMAVHQNHPAIYSAKGSESTQNQSLAQDTGMSRLFTLLDATHLLTPAGLLETRLSDSLDDQGQSPLLETYRLAIKEACQEQPPSTGLDCVRDQVIAASYWYQSNQALLVGRPWDALPSIWKAHRLVPAAYPWRRLARRLWLNARRLLSRVLMRRGARRQS